MKLILIQTLSMPVRLVVEACEPSLSLNHGNFCLNAGYARLWVPLQFPHTNPNIYGLAPIMSQRELDLVLTIRVAG